MLDRGIVAFCIGEFLGDFEVHLSDCIPHSLNKLINYGGLRLMVVLSNLIYLVVLFDFSGCMELINLHEIGRNHSTFELNFIEHPELD